MPCLREGQGGQRAGGEGGREEGEMDVEGKWGWNLQTVVKALAFALSETGVTAAFCHW